MLTNSSTNDSLHYNSSTSFSIMYCFFNRPSSLIFTMFFITYILLLLPLCILILYRGLREWWKKSSASSAATMSHSECFTYHLVILELIGVFGSVLNIFGIYRLDSNILSMVGFQTSFILHGETMFQVLMCVDRYLAVIHPITYVNLRNKRGIRIRNISIFFAWLISFTWTILVKTISLYIVLNFFIQTTLLAFVFFCSLSVLRVLIRPSPGEQGGGNERADQSKLRAFYIIVAILGVLVLKLAWGLARTFMYVLKVGNNCIMMSSGFFCYLPSSLVAPLLFLHRVGRLNTL